MTTETKTPENRIAELRARAQKLARRAAQMELKELAKEGRESRAKRTRELAHMGGMMAMVGLDRFRFSAGETPDNPQDDLKANLLVGSLLKLSTQLENATPEQLHDLEVAGQNYRANDPSFRVVPGGKNEFPGPGPISKPII